MSIFLLGDGRIDLLGDKSPSPGIASLISKFKLYFISTDVRRYLFIISTGMYLNYDLLQITLSNAYAKITRENGIMGFT